MAKECQKAELQDRYLSKVDATNYNTQWIDAPTGGGTDNSAELTALETRFNNISQQSISITGSDSNSLNYATSLTGTLTASNNLSVGVHTLYTDSEHVIATL